MIRVAGISELYKVTDEILSLYREGYHILLLQGDLGSGKTTLVQHLCAGLGVKDPASSPTFSLVNEYTAGDGRTICHMDLYRLNKSEDLIQIGFDEYITSGALCLIEWPEIAMDQITPPFVRVEISVEKDNLRIFRISRHDEVDT